MQGPRQTTRTPVAIGSSVPACPIFTFPDLRVRRWIWLTASREVQPFGLWRFTIPHSSVIALSLVVRNNHTDTGELKASVVESHFETYFATLSSKTHWLFDTGVETALFYWSYGRVPCPI